MTHDMDQLLNPPDGLYTTLRRPDGTRIRTVEAGAGIPVVLAHGYLGNLSAYNLMFEELVSTGYRVIAFDQRGHGDSTIGSDGMSAQAIADDYDALMQHYDVTDGLLVGHSMGAFASVLFALNHPAAAVRRLRGMLLISGHAGDIARGSLPNRVQIPLIRWGVMRLMTSSKLVGHASIRPLFGDVADPTLLEACRLAGQDAMRRDNTGILRDQVQQDHYSRLSEVSVKTVVLCGERDQTCPRWHSERLGAEIPSARNVWLPGVGHMVPYEAPDVILREIRSFG